MAESIGEHREMPKRREYRQWYQVEMPKKCEYRQWYQVEMPKKCEYWL